MRKLTRPASPPSCLSKFDDTKHLWDKVKTKHKKEIWRHLAAMQHEFCVYCELPAKQGKGHLEHFYHKGAKDAQGIRYNKHLTFSWDNLFGCCDNRGHCGHYKDQILPGNIPRPYKQNLLIKPDQDDPTAFLQFLNSGEVEKKTGLNKTASAQANETIKALHLSCTSLKNSRNGVLTSFRQRLINLELLSNEENIDEDDYDNLYNEIEADAAKSKHRTAIQQVLF